MSTLDEKLKALDLEFLHGVPVHLAQEMVDQIKQAFQEAGFEQRAPKVQDGTLYPLVWAKANGYKTGGEWLRRFKEELWTPPKFELIKPNDDGESNYRLFRVSGQWFMYDRAVEAAQRASGVSND